MLFPDHHADRRPEAPAYVIDGVAVDYRTMVDNSIRTANLMRDIGLVPGDVVAILLPNVPGLLDIAWSAQRSGLRYTSVASHLTAEEIAYILTDSGAKVVFTCTALADVAAAAIAMVSPTPLAAFSIDGEAAGLPDLRPARDAQPAVPNGPESEGVDLLYSSGTTGRPKGVAATLGQAPLGTLSGTAPFLINTWGFDESTVYLSPAPMYHSAPLRTSMAVQRMGGTVVIMPKFKPEPALELIAKHQVTHTQMVPTMFVRLLQLDDEVRLAHDVSSLRAVIHAAAPCPPSVKQAMIAWLGPIVDEFYSSTEAPLVTLIRSEEALARPGSVGRPVLGTPHICDDEGNVLPVGTPGTIWSEGGVDFEYLNAPEKTAATRNELGWRTVGDLGYLDEEGFLYISDRRDDLILVGGVNVYPQEIENVLIEHAAVQDVAVIGVPDLEYGQRVAAFITPNPGHEASDALAQQIIADTADRLSRVKQPRIVEFVDELPRTPTGKLLKRVLREEYKAESR
ncbi:AMP-binding protein [Aeromicrobium alkaliterrae]|uniref:Acyl-CoA synthetase n=1 Tax=Aeromicrobium alkaliterrae TaxID=302168 RepID=A0ABP4W1S2_9ACTN